MSASSPSPLPQATANAALAILERYRRDVRALATAFLDVELYHRVQGDVDQLRHACADLPQVSLQWVEVLISHAELLHCLWTSGEPDSPVGAEERQVKLQRHLQRVDSLMLGCLRLAREGPADAPPPGA